MIQRARSFLQDSEPAVATIVGVVGGLALYNVFIAIGYGFVVPIFNRLNSGHQTLDFTLGGFTFSYLQLIVDLTALLLIAAVAYVLFIWRDGESLDAAPDTRDCPECRSEIHIDASRCPYCTSVVPPLPDTDGA